MTYPRFPYLSAPCAIKEVIHKPKSKPQPQCILHRAWKKLYPQNISYKYKRIWLLLYLMELLFFLVLFYRWQILFKSLKIISRIDKGWGNRPALPAAESDGDLGCPSSVRVLDDAARWWISNYFCDDSSGSRIPYGNNSPTYVSPLGITGSLIGAGTNGCGAAIQSKLRPFKAHSKLLPVCLYSYSNISTPKEWLPVLGFSAVVATKIQSNSAPMVRKWRRF